MQELSLRPVYQAGTLSGNPLATAAGLSVLRRLRDTAVYDELERRGARLEAGLSPQGRFARVGAMATLFADDTEQYAALFRHLLERGSTSPLPVRGDVPVARPRGRRDRPHDRGRCRFRRAEVFGALREPEEGELEPVFSPLAQGRFARGLETIYEGYLVHYGRPRRDAALDGDAALVLGDYLYAQGLARIASLGDVDAVFDLAELISLCAQCAG